MPSMILLSRIGVSNSAIGFVPPEIGAIADDLPLAQALELVPRETELSAEHLVIVLADRGSRRSLQSLAQRRETQRQVRVGLWTGDGMFQGLKEAPMLELCVEQQEMGVTPSGGRNP